MMQPASSDSGFVPRKEFIRDQRTISDFALLTVSGASFIRLYSFPLDVIVDLRRLLDHFYLNAASREDSSQKLCEFQLHGKPWASPKSARTERILLDVIRVVYKHGYAFLSTINYGRERDDRLAVSFARPSASVSVPPQSPIPAGSGSNLSHTTPKNERKIPFAISFVSSTTMRVLDPPRNSMPAILQAVRGSWPRGVVSERKVSDETYEFKLKGYSWFNEDTFATDSLHQIISLLSSLDAHAFSLVASLSFNGQSRSKDLWVFIGPGCADPYELYRPASPISQSGSMLDVRRSKGASTPDQSSNPDVGTLSSSLHRRGATVPQLSSAHMFPLSQPASGSHHVRAATEPNAVQPHLTTTLPLTSPRAAPGNGMRKPAPRAQVPVSVDMDVHEEDSHERFRTSLASVVPSSCENMTGVGAQNRRRFNSNTTPADTSGTSGEPDNDDEETVHPPHREIIQGGSSSPRRVSALRPVSTRSKTPPLLTSHARDGRVHPAANANEPSVGVTQTKDSAAAGESPPLLSPGMFRVRDSAFSANSIATAASCEVPMKWSAGLGRPEGIGAIEEETDQCHEGPLPRHASPPPQLPGGWTTSAEEERPVENGEASRTDKNTTRPQHGKSPDRSLHDVDVRITSPEVVHEDVVRHSEAGLIGMISPPQPQSAPSPLPMPSKESLGKARLGGSDPPASPTKTGSRSDSTDRWVFVHLEGNSNHHTGHLSPLASPTTQQAGDRGRRSSAHVTQNGRGSSPAEGPAVGGFKDGKSPRSKTAGGSGLRRLLSFGGGVGRSGRVRNKLTRLGTAEAPAAKPSEKVRIKLD